MAGCGASKQAASQAETLASKHSGASRPFATLGLSAAGQPRYFADIVSFSGSVGSGPVQIRSSATGALVRHQPAIYALGIAAYDGGSRLLIARQAGHACASRLYSATLSGRGVLGRLSRIGPRLHGLVWALAADTDGTIVGTTIAGCEKGQSGYLAVIHIRAGSVRRWGSVNLGGTGGDLSLGFGLSMSANGRLLAFTGEATSAGGTNAGQRVWVLRTAAPAGTLAQRSRVVLSRPNSGPALSSVVLSPDGRSFYLCTVSTKGTVSAHKTVTQTAVITARQTSDGASTSRLAKLTATGVTFQGFGCPTALTPNGRYLLAPYQLRYGKNTMVPPLVRAAVIRTTSHARRSISFRLPGSGGMSVADGITVAW